MIPTIEAANKPAVWTEPLLRTEVGVAGKDGPPEPGAPDVRLGVVPLPEGPARELVREPVGAGPDPDGLVVNTGPVPEMGTVPVGPAREVLFWGDSVSH